MSTSTHPFRVLSLDGGGMRGTYTATYLDRVAKTFANRRQIAELDIGLGFDLIVGTSTGGIIACALAKGIPLRDVVTLYKNEGPNIFGSRLPRGIWGVATDIYQRSAELQKGALALEAALKARLGSTTIGEVYATRGIALSIPAVEMSQHRSWVFKTPHLEKTTNHRDDNYTLVDVCLATSAAPVYRSMAAIQNPDNTVADMDGPYRVFVDGGLWANNPVLVGLTDALSMTSPGQEIQLFCLGTCPLPAGEQINRKDVSRGLPDWKFGGDVASLSIDAQQFAYDNMAKMIARHVDRKCSIIRFPAEKVPAGLLPYLELDDTSAEAFSALVNQANTDADMTNSICAHPATDDARSICALFNSIPPLSKPLASRRP